ncbi:MAG: UDP-N-acetylmuramate--L-alanine ligase [Flavobacteriales bacterium]|nr:UDP-N-acetylmuramate--L-alanine ligase [Flavobacteriales bacterium]
MRTVPHKIFFVGIGGIGMSGLARYFARKGALVAGYDRSISSMTKALTEEGIDVTFDADPEKLAQAFSMDPDVLVVRTPAVPCDLPLLKYWKELGARIVKRAELLGAITRDLPTTAVAGTHGKTTVSSMLAHMMSEGGVSVNAFLGGVAANYGTNVLLHDDAVSNIVEADEFDRSFLHLDPVDAIITSMDPDHLDIYGSVEDMRAAYRDFADRCSGQLLVNDRVAFHFVDRPVRAYGFEKDSTIRVTNVIVKDGAYQFDLFTEDTTLTGIRAGMPGRHNVENACAAAAMGLHLGLDDDQVRRGIASFKGVQRRFQVHVNTPELVFVDDYAHHPAEIDAAIRSVRELWPGRRITGVFQPHLYSRTRDLAVEFARSLGALDELILLDIYPARERPIPGVTSRKLLDLIPLARKRCMTLEEVRSELSGLSLDVLLTLGAGSIDSIVPALAAELTERSAS